MLFRLSVSDNRPCSNIVSRNSDIFEQEQKKSSVGRRWTCLLSHFTEGCVFLDLVFDSHEEASGYSMVVNRNPRLILDCRTVQDDNQRWRNGSNRKCIKYMTCVIPFMNTISPRTQNGICTQLN